MRKFLILASLAFATVAPATPLPFDEAADAKADLQQALTSAQASHVPVLVILGANWCDNCRALDAAMRRGPSAELLSRAFKVVRVDIGNFDHNLDLAYAFGNRIHKGDPGGRGSFARTAACCMPARTGNSPMPGT